MKENTQGIRRYDIDWLRILAVLLLIPFHTMHIFILQPYSVVYIKNATGSTSYEMITRFIHEFHMPLLFFLAGASAYFSLQSRSWKKFIKERISRLLIPLITGILLLIPPMTYIYRISQGDNISLLNHYIGFFTQNPGDLSGITGAFTPAHLWFILFLFVFSLVAIPVFNILSKNRMRGEKLQKLLAGRLGLLLFTIPLALAAAINILEDKNPLVYFLIFIFGYIVISKEEYQKAIDRDKGIYLILGIVCEMILVSLNNSFSEGSISWYIYKFIEVSSRLILVYVLVGFGHKWLNHPSKALSYLSKAAFPVYMLHFPINTAVGYFIVKTPLGINAKAIVIILLTTIVTFAIYEVLRRIKPICFLLGIK